MDIKPVAEKVFPVTIPVTSALEDTCTKDISIHGIPWKFWFNQIKINSKQVVRIILTCEDSSPEYAHVAFASYKLMPNFGDAVIEHFMEPSVFKNNGLGKGVFVPCSEFQKQKILYVKDGAIKFKIKIVVANPEFKYKSQLKFDIISQCCNYGNRATLRMSVTHMSRLLAVRTPIFFIQGLPWDIIVYSSHAGFLEVRLQYKGDKSKLCKTLHLSVKLHSFRSLSESLNYDTIIHFRSQNSFKTPIISWEKLFDDAFVRNNTVQIQVTLEAIQEDEIESDAKFNARALDRSPFLKIDCAICSENLKNKSISSTVCGHVFCSPCITDLLRRQPICPLCKAPTTVKHLRRIYLTTNSSARNWKGIFKHIKNAEKMSPYYG